MPDPATTITLRPYVEADETPAIELWRRTWQESYPAIDFAARLDWWRARWRHELVPTATIMVAEMGGEIVGFVTVNAATGYLDQIVVASHSWGRGIAALLLAEARRLSPAGLDLQVNTDNGRAIRFYQKYGFVAGGEDVNPVSGRPVLKMHWRP